MVWEKRLGNEDFVVASREWGTKNKTATNLRPAISLNRRHSQRSNLNAPYHSRQAALLISNQTRFQVPCIDARATFVGGCLVLFFSSTAYVYYLPWRILGAAYNIHVGALLIYVVSTKYFSCVEKYSGRVKLTALLKKFARRVRTQEWGQTM